MTAIKVGQVFADYCTGVTLTVLLIVLAAALVVVGLAAVIGMWALAITAIGFVWPRREAAFRQRL